MKHIWSVLCRHSIIDRETNNISIIDVLEGVQIKRPTTKAAEKGGGKTALPISCEVISFFQNFNQNKDCKFKNRLDVVLPGNITEQGKENEVVLPIGPKRLRHRNRITKIPFTVSGTYTLLVKIQEENSEYKTVAELPLDITINNE
jgi:hypothetical protein